MRIIFILLLLPSLLIASDKPLSFTASFYGDIINSLEPEAPKNPHSMVGEDIVRKCVLVKEGEVFKILFAPVYSEKTRKPVTEAIVENKIAGILKWLLRMTDDQVFRIIPKDKSSKDQGRDFYTVSPNDPISTKTPVLPMYRRIESYSIDFEKNGITINVLTEGILSKNGDTDVGNCVHVLPDTLESFIDPNNNVLFVSMKDPKVLAEIEAIYQAELRSISRLEHGFARFLEQSGIEITDRQHWKPNCKKTLTKIK